MDSLNVASNSSEGGFDFTSFISNLILGSSTRSLSDIKSSNDLGGRSALEAFEGELEFEGALLQRKDASSEFGIEEASPVDLSRVEVSSFGIDASSSPPPPPPPPCLANLFSFLRSFALTAL